MPVTCEGKDRVYTVKISGEVDHHRVKEMMMEIDRMVDVYLPRHLTVDMGQVTFMDSSGIALLLRCQRRLRELGGELQVVDVPSQAYKVLRAAGLHRMIEIGEQ